MSTASLENKGLEQGLVGFQFQLETDDEPKRRDICTQFNENEGKGGYTYLVSILTLPARLKKQTDKLDKLNGYRVKAYEILRILVEDSDEGVTLLLEQKQTIDHLLNITNECAKYKGYRDVFDRLIDLLKAIATKNIHDFMDYVIKEAKFIKVMANILLDSDALM